MATIVFNSPRLVSVSSVQAAAFAVAGIYFLSSKNWFLGTIALIIAIWTRFLHKGVDFDLDCRRYRLYMGLHKWKIGPWTQLPTISGVTIKYFSEIITTEDEAGLRTDKAARLILLLFVTNSSQGIIIQQFDLTEKEHALIMGARIAAIFQVPLTTFI